jgi:hypothetical protein
MNRIAFLLSACVLTLALSGCSNSKGPAEVDFAKPYLTISCDMDQTSRFPPVTAIWIENPENGRTASLYVTGKAKIRPSALPVWAGLETPDIVTSATPAGPSFEISLQLPKQFIGSSFIIYLETNVSYDYNEYYRENALPSEACYSDVNGQPSIVWKWTVINSALQIPDTPPEIAGHGEVLGANSQISDETSKITTAFGILRNMKCNLHGL